MVCLPCSPNQSAVGLKERAWTAQAEAQGETFYPLAIEAGGTLNARFHEFLQLLTVASSPSPAERAAFLAFALQRIRAVGLKGTCAIILARHCPWGRPQTRGPALDSTEATPTCRSLRIPTPTPSATGCVGWSKSRRALRKIVGRNGGPSSGQRHDALSPPSS